MAITRVNTTGDFDSGGAGTIVSPSFVATAGNLIVVAVRSNVSCTAVTDTAGNNYLRIDEIGSGTLFSMWATWNCTGHAANVVTATFSGSPSNRGIGVVQYAGIDVRPLDTFAIRVGVTSGNTITTPTFDTSEADEVVVSFAQVNAIGSTWTPNGGATKFFGSDADDVIMGMERIYSAVQAGVTASVDCTNTTEVLLISVAFAATRSGGGGGTAGYSRGRVVNG